jgi:hypothetical protein
MKTIFLQWKIVENSDLEIFDFLNNFTLRPSGNGRADKYYQIQSECRTLSLHFVAFFVFFSPFKPKSLVKKFL